MLWKTVGDNLEEEFNAWCVKVGVAPYARMMLEFLGAEGYLKIKKAAKKYVKEQKFPSGLHHVPLRKALIPPARCVYFEKE